MFRWPCKVWSHAASFKGHSMQGTDFGAQVATYRVRVICSLDERVQHACLDLL